MSEEFLRVAKKELTADIAEIGNLLKTCSSDADVIKNASEIEKHTHKIKGLAPMMNQEEIGQIATLLDKILKGVPSGKSDASLYQTMSVSHKFMQDAIEGDKSGFEALRSEIEHNYKDLLK
ncbi:MAG: Hpt domain-containing protein [Thaumarchaeota archaeon]|nr:Hpt domain-containing protein [Nitrososphaerota archaeon]